MRFKGVEKEEGGWVYLAMGEMFEARIWRIVGGGGQEDGTSAICESLRSVDKEDLPMSPLTPNQRWWPPNSADLQAGALLESSGLQAAGCNRRCGIGVNTEKLQGF